MNQNNVVTLNINVIKVSLFQRFQLQHWLIFPLADWIDKKA